MDKGKQTDWADFPPEKVAFFMSTPQWCRKQATALGEHVEALVEGLLEPHALYRLAPGPRRARLADKYGTERLDAACRRAIEIGDPEYKTVKGILVAGTENEGEPEPAAPDVPAHLHGPLSLFENLATRRRDNEDTPARDDTASCSASRGCSTLSRPAWPRPTPVSSATSSSSSRCAKTRWPGVTQPASPDE